MGVTEWYVNGSPIDTLREILKRRTQSRPGGPPNPPGHSPKALAKVVGSGGPGSSLEARSPADLHLSPLAKKLPPPPGSPLGHSPTASPPPTARKMFSGLATSSLTKKLKPEQMRVEIKREMLPGALHGELHPSEGPWVAPREDMAPLNLCKCDPGARHGEQVRLGVTSPSSSGYPEGPGLNGRNDTQVQRTGGWLYSPATLTLN